MKNEYTVIEGVRVKNPPLLNKPSFIIVDKKGEEMKRNFRDVALTLSKNHPYQEYVLKDDDILSEIVESIEKGDCHGLYIIRRQKKNRIVGFAFCDREKSFNMAHAKNIQDSIVAGHKLTNASKKFKLRQATGNDRNYRWKTFVNNYNY